jgi:hypothetical protein
LFCRIFQTMEAYNLDTFKALDRYRYLRSNFIAAYHGGSQQHRKRDLGPLRRRGLLALPKAQEDSKNYRYCPRVYELAPKGKIELLANGSSPTDWRESRQFWHRLMIADIVMSFEIACKERGLHFRHRTDIIGTEPLQFKSSISHQFSKQMEHYDGALQPDDLFAINNTYFVLEADRQQEPITRSTLSTSSYLRKILQYRAVLKSGSYKDLIPNMMVLNITTSPTHAENIQTFMLEELRMSSSALLFKGIDVLGSRDEYPDPFTHVEIDTDTRLPKRVAGGLANTLFDESFQRVGHPDFIISKET